MRLCDFLRRRRRGSQGTALGPVNTAAPAVTGTAQVGQTLSCSSGTWTGNGTITYGYEWLRDGAAISGATSNSYNLQAADEGAQVSCRVTATDDDASRAALSNSLTIAAAPSGYDLFVPSGSDSFITSEGDTFKVAA